MGRDTKVKGPMWGTKEYGEAMKAGAETNVGVKLDAGKPPLTMGVLNYFPNALLAVANVSAYGAKKYKLSLADKNWMRVPDGFARYSDALGRHLTYEANGPFDSESGLLHAQMAAWNALARLELLCQNIELAKGKGENEEE